MRLQERWARNNQESTQMLPDPFLHLRMGLVSKRLQVRCIVSFLNLYNYGAYVYNLRRVKFFLWTATINLITLSFVHACKGNIYCKK